MNTKILQTKTDNQVFVNLLTDAGFKAVYADPANKSLLINLLNTVLPDDVRVSDIVEYRDREQTPDTIYSKKTVLDLVCKDTEGNILGVEVQKKVDSRLFSRCVYYAAGQYHSQLLAGGDYSTLHPVFEIAFLAENYSHENPEHWDANHIVSHYTFTEKRTGEIPNPTIFIILAEIGRFNKAEEECLTTRDRLFYWFRHANEFKEKPAWLDDPETKALLTASEIAAFTPEKKEQYEQDMKNEQDIEYEKSICYREGREEGREEGLKEGQIKIAHNLQSMGMPFEFIQQATKLTEDELRKILS
ncbi:MAG: Rpn family recombination-promoting nuclease/putative transposase [Candidatus Cryptobacteroides sp.]